MPGSTVDYHRRYYARHRAQMNINAKAWQLRNRQKYLARKRVYYAENREAISFAKRMNVCLAVARGMLKRVERTSHEQVDTSNSTRSLSANHS